MEIKKNPVLKTSEENLVEISWPKIWTWIYAGLRPIVHMGFRSPSARFNSGTLPRWGTGIPRWKRIAPPVLTSWGQVLSGLGRRRMRCCRRIARRRAGDTDIDPLLPCAWVSPHSAAVLLQVESRRRRKLLSPCLLVHVILVWSAWCMFFFSKGDLGACGDWLTLELMG